MGGRTELTMTEKNKTFLLLICSLACFAGQGLAQDRQVQSLDRDWEIVFDSKNEGRELASIRHFEHG